MLSRPGADFTRGQEPFKTHFLVTDTVTWKWTSSWYTTTAFSSAASPFSFFLNFHALVHPPCLCPGIPGGAQGRSRDYASASGIGARTGKRNRFLVYIRKARPVPYGVSVFFGGIRFQDGLDLCQLVR